MNYQIIDDVLDAWAKLHNLKVIKLYKDMQVRSVNIVDSTGAKYQIWIDPIEGKHEIKINYWDYKNKDRKSTRLNSSHIQKSRMPSSA